MEHKRKKIYKDLSKTRINQNIKYKGLKYNLKQLKADHSQYIKNAFTVGKQSFKAVCDITGLPARYKCSKTGIFCHDLSVYEFVREMKSEDFKRYLAQRNIGKNIYAFIRE
ncbi:hypothetical protein EDEG_02763 [Edhazardia aedis USNM 41457]|uniref:Vps72/YL1 C-terminal domain-containing protein n=1 Tax=Edhazardia aedis (strain USNM 41457) TaxID=1003232 RepID=J9DJP8_EDHAE|nr:hypothetical protein EDEG_02763 [Edhazardia aedis USNM 41457]|eukprot:EJW02850.1 hypothetical protein EDEG_02763 [Edhazardia aedis USNM 41457]